MKSKADVLNRKRVVSVFCVLFVFVFMSFYGCSSSSDGGDKSELVVSHESLTLTIGQETHLNI